MNKKIEEVFSILDQFDQANKIYKCEEDGYTLYYNAVIASFTQLILCRNIFKKNSNVVDFLERRFNIIYPKYISKNRSLILGRTIKYISEIDDSERIKEILNNLYEVVSKLNNNNFNLDNMTWDDAIKSLDLSRI